MVVDLPESTWPMTTTLICVFSLLRASLARCVGDGGCYPGSSRLQSLTHPMV